MINIKRALLLLALFLPPFAALTDHREEMPESVFIYGKEREVNTEYQVLLCHESLILEQMTKLWLEHNRMYAGALKALESTDQCTLAYDFRVSWVGNKQFYVSSNGVAAFLARVEHGGDRWYAPLMFANYLQVKPEQPKGV